MISPHRPSSPRDAGFSLIELGIVIAVIAVLTGAVILSKGFIDSAKRKSAIDMITSLRAASREFSIRHNGGVSYGDGHPAKSVNIRQLRAEGFLPHSKEFTTPWGSTNISVAPESSAANCAGNTCIKIVMGGVPDGTDPTCSELAHFFDGQAATLPTCVNGTVTIIVR